MTHVRPWIFQVGSIVTCAVVSHLEAGGGSLHSQIHNVLVVGGRFDGIGVAGLVQFYCDIFGVKVGLGLVEAVVTERVGGPEMLSGAIVVEDFGIELGGGVKAAVRSVSI